MIEQVMTRVRTVPVLLYIAAVLLATTIAGSFISQTSYAADGSNFRAGRIIDDAIFYNDNAMTASQIQTFLNGKVPSCDTNGTGIATEFGSSLTRAQYAASRGWQSPPYTCLRNFVMNTPQVEAASQLCDGISARTGRTAAQIIFDVAKACGINPQVLVVLLEKEQSLVTDRWPLDSQYRHATGFACPDTAPCNDAFSGFFFQTYYAARQFKIYKTSPNNYNYIAGRNNTVLWHPNSACGTSSLFIENQATAGLYIYTPYRPNQAALNNLYGTGNSCSSYGNRNFWRIFTDWFGPTTGPLIESSGLLLYGWNTGKQITAVFDIKNTTKSDHNVDLVRVRAVNEHSDQYLFPSRTGLVLKPGERYRYEQSLTITEEGNYTFTIDRRVGSTWYPVPFSDFNFTGTTSLTRNIYSAPTINTSLQFNRSSIHVNEPVSATFTVNNPSQTRTADIGLLKVEGVGTNSEQFQFPSNSGIVLAPGGVHSYNRSLSFDRSGTFQFHIVNNSAGRSWNTTFPETASGAVNRVISVNVKPQVTLSEGLTMNTLNAREGDTLTASFKLRNFGTTPVTVGTLKVEAFDASGRQVQFPSTASNLSIAPGQEFTYSQSRPAPLKGVYTFRIVHRSNSAGWSTTTPTSESSGLARSATVRVKYPVDTTSSLSITPTSPFAGSSATATFTIENFGTTAFNVGTLKVEAFDALGRQVQFPSTPNNLIIAPGDTYTYTGTATMTTRGTFNFRIIQRHPQFGWNMTLPASHTGSVVRSQTVIVQ